MEALGAKEIINSLWSKNFSLWAWNNILNKQNSNNKLSTWVVHGFTSLQVNYVFKIREKPEIIWELRWSLSNASCSWNIKELQAYMHCTEKVLYSLFKVITFFHLKKNHGKFIAPRCHRSFKWVNWGSWRWCDFFMVIPLLSSR